MEEKDFLNQFSTENKPDSFKEEERIPVHKDKKPVNVKLIAILAAVALLLVGAIYFFFLRPKIEVEDFTDRRKEDAVAWVRQQGIETSGILFREEYNFDTAEGNIIFQSIKAGKKIKKNAKMTFTVSLGPDPNEKISVPNIASMDKEDIERWISINKLLKTKVTTMYSGVVPAGEVIDYSFNGCDEDTFTRGCTLKINVSKGEEEVKSVTVENFIGKEYSLAETWARNNGVTLSRQDAYSDTVEVGKIADQSVSGGSKMKVNETLIIYISKGKGTKMPNLNSMSKEQVNDFLDKYMGILKVTYKYSTSTNYVLSQKPYAGSVIGADTTGEVVINKGNSYYASDIGISNIVGMKATQLEDILNSVRPQGIDAYMGAWANPDGVYSYVYPKGTIVSVKVMNSKDEPYALDGRLPLDTRFDVVISKGKISAVDLSGCKNSAGTAFMTAKISDELSSHSIPFSVDTTKSECDLYINGYKIDASLNSVEITEGQTVALK